MSEKPTWLRSTLEAKLSPAELEVLYARVFVLCTLSGFAAFVVGLCMGCAL